MKDLINKELLALQNELQNLDKAVKHISDAQKIAAGLIDYVRTIQQKYEGYLDKSQQLYQTHLTETQTTAQQFLSESQEIYRQLSDSHQLQIAEVKKIMNKYLELAEVTSELSKELKQSDIENRLLRMEGVTSATNMSITKIDGELNSLKTKLNQLNTDRRADSVMLKNHSSKLTWLIVITLFSVLISGGVLGYLLTGVL